MWNPKASMVIDVVVAVVCISTSRTLCRILFCQK